MAQIHERRGPITRESTQLSKASSRDAGSWGNISFTRNSSNEGLRSPTSLGNASFGSGSLIGATGAPDPSTLTKKLNNNQLSLLGTDPTTDVLTEKFAETLDQVSDLTEVEYTDLTKNRDNANKSEDELKALAKHKSALWLLDELSFITDEVLKKMKSKLGKEAEEQLFQLSKAWRNRIQSMKETKDSLSNSFRASRSRRFDSSVLDEMLPEQPDVRDVRKVQAERDTFELVKPLFNIRKPPPMAMSLSSSLILFNQARGEIGPYTPEEELWERFLLSNQSAREVRAVLSWLEKSAASSEGLAQFRTIIGELESAAGIQSGTWNHGFLHTRERLKSQKRKRQTDMLKSSLLRNSENMEPLVTHLDPDVIAREERNLEKADAFYDRALWLTCFAMMRQGLDWQSFRDWCDEHNEGWRVGSFGMLADAQNSRVGLNGPEAGMLWRRMCLAQAQQANIDPYQRAVYGLLAGDFTSVLPVCKSFEDVLYAKYSALLIQSFEDYLEQEFGHALSDKMRKAFPSVVIPSDEKSWNEATDLAENVFTLRNSSPISSSEANNPFKLIQTSIIADDLPTLIIHLGGIVSQRANANLSAKTRSRLIPLEKGEYDKTYACIVDDFDALRTVIHIANIMISLGYEFTAEHQRYLNHIIVAYVDMLRLAGKIDMVPTYASLLSIPTKHKCLGKLLVDITDRSEQTRLLNLISDTKTTNIAAVISEAIYHAANVLGILHSHRALQKAGEFAPRFFEGLSDKEMMHFWPALRVRRKFELKEISFGQERLVHAVEWFLAIPSMWQDTFKNVGNVLSWFMECAWYGPALALTKRIPYKKLIAQKITGYLPESVIKGTNPRRSKGEVFDLWNDHHVGYLDLDEQGRFKIDMLRDQARPLKELQELVLALEQAVQWRDLEDEVLAIEAQRGIGAEGVDSQMRTQMNTKIQELAAGISPILSLTFLQSLQLPVNEHRKYDDIRRIFLVCVLISYLSARYFASRYLGASVLLPCFEISSFLADPRNEVLMEDIRVNGNLTNVMIEMGYISKRMLELGSERELDGRLKELEKMRGKLGGDLMEEDEIEEFRSRKRKAKSKEDGGQQKRTRYWEGEDVEMWDVTKVV